MVVLLLLLLLARAGLGGGGGMWARKWFWLKLTTLPRVTEFAAAPDAPAWEGAPTCDPTCEPG